MLKQVLEQVAAPGAEFRGAPFWAWNGKLSPDELRRQIRCLKFMGLGGFFMHARVGLNTEYLGKEWFLCIQACLDEARKNGMLAWLYDEDRWPSGAAGGLVTRDRIWRQRELRMRVFATPPANFSPDGTDDKIIAVFTAVLEKDGIHASDLRRLNSIPASWKPKHSLLVFHRIIHDDSSWFNGQSYLDTMNPEAVKRFIELTHEKYRREIGNEFGQLVPGIFTDEPNYLHIMDTQGTAWTDSLPENFLREYGYELLDHLPELFCHLDGQEFSKARLDYRNLCSKLFTDAFSRLIGEWCGENSLQMTGHVLREDDLVRQTPISGAVMRFYEHMQAPGIDLLTEHWGIFSAGKQCTSVAHQFGRARRLTETYGCTGWDFPFAGHKALGDWQYAMGINYRCQHLAWYSMAAEAKRDYPASISYQSPWHRHYSVVEDYFGRLGAALSEGEESRRLLVIHPIESTFGWLLPFHGSYPFPKESDEELLALTRLTNSILATNIDFDFGDEEIMTRHASIQANGELRVGQAAYQSVLVPQLRTIRHSTLKLLSEFAAGGGFVGYYIKPPARVDGIPTNEAEKIFAKFRCLQASEFSEVFSPSARQVSLTNAEGKEIEPLLHLLKQVDDHLTLFICNYGTNFLDDHMGYGMVGDRNLVFPDVYVAVNADAGLQVCELDLGNGALCGVDAEYRDGRYFFRTAFPPLGSRLFFFQAGELPAAGKKNVKPRVDSMLSSTVLPVAGWQVSPDDFNVLVLDHAYWRIKSRAESKYSFILSIDDELRGLLGAKPRGGKMVQPWITREKPPERELDLELKYKFNCREVPSADCFLALERPELYEISVNGHQLLQKDCGYWCDISLRRLCLPAEYFQDGVNTIILSCRYHQYLPGLESIFLLGDFGVDSDGNTLLAAPTKLTTGDWCTQGFCNYAGNLTYRSTFLHQERPGSSFSLEIRDWRGVALIVRLNGNNPHMLPWPPYSLNLANELKEGCNILEITVLGHRRNSHGPFYLKEKWPRWTGPGEFKSYDSTRRQLVPCGLLTPPILIERQL
jgi:hypothetical protein